MDFLKALGTAISYILLFFLSMFFFGTVIGTVYGASRFIFMLVPNFVWIIAALFAFISVSYIWFDFKEKM